MVEADRDPAPVRMLVMAMAPRLAGQREPVFLHCSNEPCAVSDRKRLKSTSLIK